MKNYAMKYPILTVIMVASLAYNIRETIVSARKPKPRSKKILTYKNIFDIYCERYQNDDDPIYDYRPDTHGTNGIIVEHKSGKKRTFVYYV